MKSKIVVIDPDKRSRRLIEGILASEYEVLVSSGVSEGYSAISTLCPDLIIIDPLFPKKDGIELIKSIREWNECPIIALSENGSEQAVVTAFKAGADDYVRKPFFALELKARIEVCLNRTKKIEAIKGIADIANYRNGDLRLEFDTRRVILKGEQIHLTKNEYKIFSLLCRHSGKVLTYDYILNSVWGPKAGNGTGILRVNVANIRHKLEKDPLNPVYLITENGVGYRVGENEEY